MARDRDARYAEAMRWAAPQAAAELNRWHLISNLAEALECHVSRRHAGWSRTLRERATAEAAAPEGMELEPVPPLGRITTPPPAELQRRQERQAWRQALFERVHELHAAEKSKREIARDTDLDWRTITNYLALSAPPDHTRNARTPSTVDAYAAHFTKRWA